MATLYIMGGSWDHLAPLLLKATLTSYLKNYLQSKEMHFRSLEMFKQIATK